MNRFLLPLSAKCRFPQRLMLVLAIVLSLAVSGCAGRGEETEVVPHHLVILGDPHLPGRDVHKKEKVVETINSWKDVEMVVAVGDICADLGTDEELALQVSFSRGCTPPSSPSPAIMTISMPIRKPARGGW